MRFAYLGPVTWIVTILTAIFGPVRLVTAFATTLRTDRVLLDGTSFTPAAPDFVVAVLNFTPVPRNGYRIGVPVASSYVELLNSDAEAYGGSNIGNGGRVASNDIPSHGHPASLTLTLPPLGFLLLKPVR